MIGRLEAVNAKLVEVEQAQPADVVDKKTVADIAAKQAAIEQATKSVAEALARLEQMVTQSLEAGNQQAAALRVVVDATRSRMDEISAQQRDLLALKDQVEKQAEADQQQLAALADTGTKVTGVRTDLEQKLSDMTSGSRRSMPPASAASDCRSPRMAWKRPWKPASRSSRRCGCSRSSGTDDPAITECCRHARSASRQGHPDLWQPRCGARQDRADAAARVDRPVRRLAGPHPREPAGPGQPACRRTRKPCRARTPCRVPCRAC